MGNTDGLPHWQAAMHHLGLQRLLWIYCPGHAGVCGNGQADILASTADITSGLQLGRAEVLRGLRNFPNMNRPEQHSIDRLKERGVDKGSSRQSAFQGREWSVFNHTNTGTVSRATLEWLLRRGKRYVLAFPSAKMPSWAETEKLKLKQKECKYKHLTIFPQPPFFKRHGIYIYVHINYNQLTGNLAKLTVKRSIGILLVPHYYNCL